MSPDELDGVASVVTGGTSMAEPLPAELAAMLPAFVDDLIATLGDRLVGAYLSGSAVTGGYDVGVSDADVLVVTRDVVSEADFPSLDGVHAGIVERDASWSDRLDIVYVGRHTLRDFRSTADPLAVISHDEPLHLEGSIAGWLQTWYLFRETGLRVLGPPPAEVIPAIRDEEFLDAIRWYVGELQAAARQARAPGLLAYSVLSACRALRTIGTGVPCSKQEGAMWARERRPDWAAVIDAASACRLTGGRSGFEDPADRAAAIAVVDAVAAAIGVVPHPVRGSSTEPVDPP
jgi:predicted nucleotidyltransferase